MSIQRGSEFIWQNNTFVAWDEASVHPMSHTLHYGVGVFEGIRAYQTDNGSAVFRLEDHIKRFLRSAKMVGMTIPYSYDELLKAHIDTLIKNNALSAYIRPMAYYGAESLGLHAKSLKTHVVIATFKLDKYHNVDQDQGMRLKTSSYRRNSIDSHLLKGKINGAYVNSVLAIQEAVNAGYDEALLLDRSGFIAEISSANIFMVVDNDLITPTIDYIFPGITRMSLIEVARDMNLNVIERNITREEMYTADEVFVSGTAAEVGAVSEIDGRMIGSGKRGKITKMLADTYSGIIQGRNKQYSHWLHRY